MAFWGGVDEKARMGVVDADGRRKADRTMVFAVGIEARNSEGINMCRSIVVAMMMMGALLFVYKGNALPFRTAALH